MVARLAGQPGARAILFDLDETLIDARRAWQYTIEEAVAAISGGRIEAAHLASEYHNRPWAHALAILLNDQTERVRCEALCREMHARSSMKRLLVHEGMGMALDRIRAGRVEMGALSREPHRLAIRQVESTGLDRFLTVLAATPDGEAWDVPARIEQALAFLECAPGDVAYVAHSGRDLVAASQKGARCFAAGWAETEYADGFTAIASPGDTLAVVLAAWGRQPALG